MYTKKHVKKENKNDNWLTPKALIKSLGYFDLDPCCPNQMPWRTAKKMICLPNNGLEKPWKGRVWCNPPFSKPLPWIEKMISHQNGILLLSGKGPETKWGQLALNKCEAVLFLKGRPLFFYENGEESKGKWMPIMLLAFGRTNATILKSSNLEGVFFWRKK